jgi:N-sulfoglucosamine sulfohydrolase
VVGLEKHGQLFPMRSLRTHQYSYIRNFMPGPYLCTDSGPTIDFLKAHADDPTYKQMAQWCFGDRPAEELYDLAKDPNELNNVAAAAAYAEVRQRMARDLEQYLRDTSDPRITGTGVEKFDAAPRYNSRNKSGRGDKKTRKK